MTRVLFAILLGLSLAVISPVCAVQPVQSGPQPCVLPNPCYR